jgi:hypothetical protein
MKARGVKIGSKAHTVRSKGYRQRGTLPISAGEAMSGRVIRPLTAPIGVVSTKEKG